MANYTIIYGNVIYKIENVNYNSNDSHRVFKRNGDVILSVPLSSILIKDGDGVKAQIINGLNTGVGFASSNNNINNNDTTVVQQSDDNFVEGMIVGGVIGSILF